METILQNLEALGIHGRAQGVLAALVLGLGAAAALACILALGLGLWCLLLYGHKDRGRWNIMRECRYAHRGLHNDKRPENSLAAFQAAAERGLGAELDVHLTRDGKLVVFHDSTLDRVCGRSGKVEKMTAAELMTCRLAGTEETIPLLEEVLPLFVGRGPLLVELKPVGLNHARLARETCDLLDRFGVNYCMESFDPRALVWLRRNRPEVVRGQLVQDFFRTPSGLVWPLRLVLTALLENFLTRPDFIACRFRDRRELPFRLCRRVWRVPEFCWTLRSPEELKAAEQAGACGIFEGFIPEKTQRGETI